MKVFISQPMKGYSNEQIENIREQIIAKAKELFGSDIEIINSFFKDEPNNAKPLWYLGKSLQKMSEADVVIFAVLSDGVTCSMVRGCRIERKCADEYGYISWFVPINSKTNKVGDITEKIELPLLWSD